MRLQLRNATRLFLISTLLFGFSISIWELFFNLYILSLNINSEMLGLIRSATPLAALILGLPLGLLSDRIGRRTGMLIGLCIGFIGMFFEIHLLNPLLIFLFGFIQGASFMLYQVAQLPFIMSISKKENQAMIFSLNFGLLTIAFMLGSFAGGRAPAWLENWLGILSGTPESYRWVITTGILFAFSSLIPIFFINQPETLVAQSVVHPPFKAIFRRLSNNRVAKRLALTNLVMGLGAALLIPYLNVFLKGKFNISDEFLGVMFGISSFLVFIGSLIAPRLVKLTHSRIIPTVASQGLSLLFLFTLGFSPLMWLVSISFLLRNVLMQMATPLLDNFAMIISEPHEQGTIASIRGMGWQLGQAGGIFISGLVQARFGFSPIFIATGLLYILSIYLTWIYFRPEEKRAVHASTF